MAMGDKLLFGLIFLVVSMGVASALSMPLSVSGTVYDANTGNQISERVYISINNTNSGFYVEGITGTFYNPGKFSASVFGVNGDSVVIRVWNEYHEDSAVVVLSGSVRNVELYLNMTPIATENLPPRIVSKPRFEAFARVLYRYDAEADDPNGDVLTFRLERAPRGMRIDTHTGVVEWVPKLWQVGKHNVVLVVEDGLGGKDIQEFELRVRLPPWFNSRIDLAHYLNVSEDSELFIRLIPFEVYKIENPEIVLKEIRVDNNVGEIYVLYGEGVEKPHETRAAGRKVFRYMQIFSLNVENELVKNVSLKFGVSKLWFERRNADKGKITLLKYVNGYWYPRETVLVSEDESNFYYESKVEGIGHFAVAERKEQMVRGDEIEYPYFVVGTIYKVDGSQAKNETPIMIENIRTKEKVRLVSGIGPMSGAYAVIIPGKAGDNVVITVDGVSRYSFKSVSYTHLTLPTIYSV